MSKKEIEFRDPIVERVVNKFVSRSDIGFAKYKVTLEDDKSNIFAWINHLQEELMDATLYLQKLKESTTEELQQAIINKMVPDGVYLDADGLAEYEVHDEERI